MPRPCTVCTHPDRDDIDSAIVADTDSLRRIASQHGIVETSLRRHRDNHLSPAIQEVHAERVAERGEVVVSLYDELQDLIQTVKGAVERAERKNHTDTMLKAVGEMRRLYELTAKLTGELANGPSLTVNVLSSEEWLRVRGVIMDVLEDHPEIRYELASRLRQLEAENE